MDTVIHFYFYFFLIHRRALCSQPIRGNVRRTGQIFPEHNIERSFLDPEYSFIAVRRIPRTRFAKQKFAQLRTKDVRRITRTMFAKQMFAQLRTGLKGEENESHQNSPSCRNLTPIFSHSLCARRFHSGDLWVCKPDGKICCNN